MMNLEAQKSELHSWINRVNDPKLINEMLLLKKKTEANINPIRKFGDGKYLIAYVADDFNDPIDHFSDDTRP